MQTRFYPGDMESEAGNLSVASLERGQTETAGQFSLFTDLGQWVPRSKLKEWIELEADKLNWVAPGAGEIPPRSLGWQIRMFALLSFAYATGVFSGEEIAEKCHRDATFHSICDGAPPFPEEVGNFRRANRARLREILTRVFLHAVAERFDLEAVLMPPELEQDLRDRACERLDLARHMDTGAYCE